MSDAFVYDDDKKRIIADFQNITSELIKSFNPEVTKMISALTPIISQFSEISKIHNAYMADTLIMFSNAIRPSLSSINTIGNLLYNLANNINVDEELLNRQILNKYKRLEQLEEIIEISEPMVLNNELQEIVSNAKAKPFIDVGTWLSIISLIFTIYFSIVNKIDSDSQIKKQADQHAQIMSVENAQLEEDKEQTELLSDICIKLGEILNENIHSLCDENQT